SGSLGFPTLTGAGDLTPGSGTGFSLTLDQAFPLQPTTMFVALSSNPSPFKGGTFYPLPILTSLAFTTDSFGQVVLPAQIPAGVPPCGVVVPSWLVDASARHGVPASNGLQCNVP